MRGKLPVTLGVAAGVVLLDQLTKAAAVARLEGEPSIPVVGDLLRLYLVRNPGAAFSLAGNYTVVVQGWGVVGSSPFKLHTWLLDSADAGNMTVTAPAAAVTGQTGNIGITTSGLTAGTKYLGSVAYAGVAGMPNPTIVRVDP